MLRYQLLLAASWQDKRPDQAISLSNYVALTAQGSVNAVELCVQATTFLARTGNFTVSFVLRICGTGLTLSGSIVVRDFYAVYPKTQSRGDQTSSQGPPKLDGCF